MNKKSDELPTNVSEKGPNWVTNVGKKEEGENKPFVNLDGEDMYMSLIENNPNDDGFLTKEKTKDMKDIFNEIKEAFPNEVDACRKLHSKECGSKLWELYKLLEKN